MRRSPRKPLAFTLKMQPVPQPRPRISMAGGFARAYTPADHPVVPYRKALATMALLSAPRVEWKKRFGAKRLRIDCWACFARPKSHYKAKGELKADAPAMPRPDIDNLLKAVMDALQDAGVIEDDVVICRGDTRKRYVSQKVGSHVFVRVY